MDAELKLVEEFTAYCARRLREENLGLYGALRVMGYVSVAMAEAVDLVGAAEEDPGAYK